MGKKPIVSVTYEDAMLLSPNSFDSQEPVPEAKDLAVNLEKRTISYLAVSARVRVTDPFSQMKGEYNTILDDADSTNCNNFEETFLKETNI